MCGTATSAISVLLLWKFYGSNWVKLVIRKSIFNRSNLKSSHPLSNVMVTPSSTDLVEFNSSISLKCSASGISLSFLWLNSSSEVIQSDRVQLTDGGATLTIVNVTRYDQGPYECHVFNPVNSDTKNVNLNVKVSKGYYLEGSNISLSCSAVSRPAAQFYWLLNGAYLNDTGPEFKLVNIQMSQSGNYSCQAFNNKTLRYETSQSSAVTVLVTVTEGLLYAFPPIISGAAAVTSSTNLPIEGNSVNLTCDAAAGSNFTRLWRKDDSDLILTDNMALYEENRVLAFKSLNKTDSGKYSCEITSHSLLYGPENQNLTLICSAQSESSASYTWTLNGTEIHNSSVFIKVFTELSDSGSYTCQAMNNITERTSSAINSGLMEFSSSVNLSCTASGSSLSFLWLDGSSEVTDTDRLQLTDENSTLTIVNVTRYDQERFRCRVSNPVSSGTSDPVTLSIIYGPENVTLTLSPSQESYVEGSSVTLSCSAVCSPSALFSWILNGRNLTDTGPELKLVNIQMSQSGNYSCQAFNNITLRYETSLVVSVLTIPGKTSGCSAGCIAGIVIACLLVCAAAAAGGYYIFIKR
uniref:Ig-like domain-containing protein n=1 Tax=Sparus aurata TaxID=8175 RepID=A0A671WCV2_SPAAU